MVAYSFRPRFASKILDGTKTGTIRRDRRRHARPGEELQLYTGMRTRHCRLIRRAICIAVARIEIDVLPERIWTIIVNGVAIDDLDVFARGDGFDDAADMHQFWLAEHKAGYFSGVWIKWA